MVSVITDKLQRQQINDEHHYDDEFGFSPITGMTPNSVSSAGSVSFDFLTPATPSKLVINDEGSGARIMPVFRKAASFDSTPANAPLSCSSGLLPFTREGKENYAFLTAKELCHYVPQRGLLGRVPIPNSSNGLPQFSVKPTQRPHTSFSAMGANCEESPHVSPPLLPPKRHCRSLNIPGLSLARPIALRPDGGVLLAGSRPSSRTRTSPRNIASPYSIRRSAFTPTPRTSCESFLTCDSPLPRPASVSSGYHEPTSLQNLLESCLATQSLPDALSGSSSMTTARACRSQPCFDLVTTPPPPFMMSSAPLYSVRPQPAAHASNIFVFGAHLSSHSNGATGRSCLPRIASSPTNASESADHTPTNSTMAADSLSDDSQSYHCSGGRNVVSATPATAATSPYNCANTDSGCSDIDDDADDDDDDDVGEDSDFERKISPPSLDSCTTPVTNSSISASGNTTVGAYFRPLVSTSSRNTNLCELDLEEMEND